MSERERILLGVAMASNRLGLDFNATSVTRLVLMCLQRSPNGICPRPVGHVGDHLFFQLTPLAQRVSSTHQGNLNQGRNAQ